MESSFTTILFLVAMMTIFYVLLVRPQQKRERSRTELLSTIEPGDEVVTIGGMYGEVVEIDDRSVLLEFYDGTQIRLVRGAISRRVDPDAEGSDEFGAEGSDEFGMDVSEDEGDSAPATSSTDKGDSKD